MKELNLENRITIKCTDIEKVSWFLTVKLYDVINIIEGRKEFLSD